MKDQATREESCRYFNSEDPSLDEDGQVKVKVSQDLMSLHEMPG
jgi:hypothetical protein